MNREELIVLAKKILFAEAASEEEMDADIERFRANVPDPEVMDYFVKNKFSGMFNEVCH